MHVPPGLPKRNPGLELANAFSVVRNEGRHTMTKAFAVFAAALILLSISAVSSPKSKARVSSDSSSHSSATIRAQQQAAPSHPAQSPNDPAVWGSNHIGKPIPEYVHGDECLFCHRNNIGTTWQK